MANTPDHLGTPRRLLEPIERINEVLFGVVMVLTYTTAIAVGKDQGDAGERVQQTIVERP